MTVSIWRIGTTAGPYLADDLSGAAAAKLGGRYNSIGTAVVYASSNVSLTILETLAHMGAQAKRGASNRYLIEIEVPDAIFAAREILTIRNLKRKRLHFWDAIPFGTTAQVVGDRFVKQGKALLLQLPSAIAPHHDIPDVNYLVNPAHADFAQLKIKRRDRFIYDTRLT